MDVLTADAQVAEWLEELAAQIRSGQAYLHPDFEERNVREDYESGPVRRLHFSVQAASVGWRMVRIAPEQP